MQHLRYSHAATDALAVPQRGDMEQTLRIAPPPRSLIINADDLGICPERDAGILELFSEGAITSASLLVNGMNAAAAAASAIAAGLPLGLHLNLSEGFLPTPNSLTDARGALLGKFDAHEALATKAVNAEDLAHQIRAQFDTFIALTGELPTHVDGHHHIHVEAAVATVLAPIMAREYGIYCVRLPLQAGLEAIASDTEFDAPFQLAVARAAKEAWPIFAAQGIYSTQAFLGQSFMGHRLQAAALGTALEQLTAACKPAPENPLTVELMVHPGIPAANEARSEFCRSPARAHEMAVLRSKDWRGLISGWLPASYRTLARPLDAAGNRPTVLIYSKLTPATGNAETTRRYAAALSADVAVRFRPVLTNIHSADAVTHEAKRLQEFAAREHLDLALGVHLYRAGAPLADAFASVEAAPLPYGLLASGTDINADIDIPERAAAITGALASADFLLCLNEAQTLRLQGLGLPADTTILGNGIDIETPSRYSLRRSLALGDDAQLIIFPASLRRLKGVLPTIDALATSLATHYRSHVLVVLGPALEADYARELRQRIKQLTAQYPALNGRILLHAGLPHTDYLAALRESCLVINASEHEGLSHGLAEAMAAGIPVLARDIPGNRLLVGDRKNGRLFSCFDALPAAYADCFEAAESTSRMAEQGRADIVAAHPPGTEQLTLRTVVARCLAKRQTTLRLASGASLRLDLAPGTHPLSAENTALFACIALSPAALQTLPQTLELAIDVGCGCGAFGLMLLDALATQGRRLQRMCFADPHQASLAALARTLTRHRPQLPLLDEASLSEGSLLSPLLVPGEKAALVCANLPQTPGPMDFRLDRYGGSDGADLVCALIAQLPAALAADGECFLLHIGLAHPARVKNAIADIGFVATVIGEQLRHARFADYTALHPALVEHLHAEHAAGRAEFVPDTDGEGFAYRAQLLRLRHSGIHADTAPPPTRCDNIVDR